MVLKLREHDEILERLEALERIAMEKRGDRRW